MKRLAMTLALMCALSTPIFAGNMPTGGFADPPPPPTTSSTLSDNGTPDVVAGYGFNGAGGTLLVSVILTVLSLR